MIERLSGKKQEILVEPKVNPGSLYLLETFFDLGATRTTGMNNALHSISYTEMKAYMELTGIELEPWEVEIIRQLDRTYIQAVYTERKEDTQDG